ncbi:MAG: polyamine ABC transporter substrate-binding protein [Alphaproteobacteria bacterium]
MADRKGCTFGRRAIIKGAGVGAAALAFPTVLTPRKTRAAQRLVARNPGGPFEKAFGEAYDKPFQQATGIEIVNVTGQHEPIATIKGMVDTKTYTWDVTILSNYTHHVLAEAGYLEPLNLDSDPIIQEIPKQFRTPYIVGNYVWSTVLAYRTDVYPSKAKAPTGGWKDLWDVKGIPGRRGMRKYPVDTIEPALLADGVTPDKLYPLDMDRAFKSLDKIKKDMTVWWSGGAQSSQLLKSGELDMCVAWNGRAQTVMDEGAPVSISWNQALWSYDGWAIPKGSPTADLARKFIRFASEAKNQVGFTPYVAYGPTNQNATKLIDSKRLKDLPTNPDYFKTMVPNDSVQWSKVQEKAVERFNTWIIS